MRDGRVVKEDLPYGLPKGMQGLVFNTRRSIFSDVRVREAILQLFDFEWINHNLFLRVFTSEPRAISTAAICRHTACRPMRVSANCWLHFPDVVRADIMDGTWSPPVTDGSGRDRPVLRRAFALFKAAGYELKGTQLLHTATGRPLSFEILTTTRDQERARARLRPQSQACRHRGARACRRCHAISSGGASLSTST